MRQLSNRRRIVRFGTAATLKSFDCSDRFVLRYRPTIRCDINCDCEGFSARLQQWDLFAETQAVSDFRVSSMPEPIQGTFNW